MGEEIKVVERIVEKVVEIPEYGFMRLPQILKVIPVSSTYWYEGIREGKYPQGIKLSPNVTVWRVEDIKALCRQISEEAERQQLADRSDGIQRHRGRPSRRSNPYLR